MGVCVPEGPRDCAKDLGDLSSSYKPSAPLWESLKRPFSFEKGNESEGLNKCEVKCRAVPVSVSSSML